VELVQSHIVTDDVQGIATFYANLIGASISMNDYYVGVRAGSSRSASPSADSPNTATTSNCSGLLRRGALILS
jgi:hypothetical protein